MNGKNRCRILKDIRKKIAEENDIEYITTECKYQGDCPGTCPKCESEVRYLERELERKRGLGKRVAIAGIAVGVTATATGCTSDIFSVFKDDTLQGAMEAEYSQNENSIKNESGVSEVSMQGDIVMVDGEMPDTMGVEPEISEEETATAGILPPPESLPEITNPYAGVKGIFVAFPFSVNEAVEKNVADVKAALVDWKREYIDYEWRENITYRYANSTLYMTDDGRYIEVFFDDDGFCKSVNIFKEELMGEPSVVEPLQGDMP
jgi:hypothetical protein